MHSLRHPFDRSWRTTRGVTELGCFPEQILDVQHYVTLASYMGECQKRAPSYNTTPMPNRVQLYIYGCILHMLICCVTGLYINADILMSGNRILHQVIGR